MKLYSDNLFVVRFDIYETNLHAMVRRESLLSKPVEQLLQVLQQQVATLEPGVRQEGERAEGPHHHFAHRHLTQHFYRPLQYSKL